MAQFGEKQLEQANKAAESAQDAEQATSGADMTAVPSSAEATATGSNATGEQQEVKQVITMLEEMRGVRLMTGLDFEPTGIAVKGSMELPQKK